METQGSNEECRADFGSSKMNEKRKKERKDHTDYLKSKYLKLEIIENMIF